MITIAADYINRDHRKRLPSLVLKQLLFNRLECTDGTLMHLSEPKPLQNVEYLKVMIEDNVQEVGKHFFRIVWF